MRTFKKIISLIVTAVIVVFVSACSAGGYESKINIIDKKALNLSQLIVTNVDENGCKTAEVTATIIPSNVDFYNITWSVSCPNNSVINANIDSYIQIYEVSTNLNISTAYLQYFQEFSTQIELKCVDTYTNISATMYINCCTSKTGFKYLSTTYNNSNIQYSVNNDYSISISGINMGTSPVYIRISNSLSAGMYYMVSGFSNSAGDGFCICNYSGSLTKTLLNACSPFSVAVGSYVAYVIYPTHQAFNRTLSPVLQKVG